MVKLLQGVGTITIIVSFLIPMALETPGPVSTLYWYIFVGGILAGMSWFALARVIELLEKINQNLSSSKKPEIRPIVES